MRTSLTKALGLFLLVCFISLSASAPAEIDFYDEQYFVRLVEQGELEGFFSIDQANKIIVDFRSRYPELFLPDEVFGKTFQNRPIIMHCITKKQDAKATFKSETETKKIALITAMTHGREPLGMTQLFYTFHKILVGYSQGDAEMVNLVDNNVVCWIPVINVDSYTETLKTYKETGEIRGIRRNRNNNVMCDKSKIDHYFGVDLNRNFDFCWNVNNKGNSKSACDYNYRGAAPFSEPETQSYKKFVEDNEGKIIVAINLHTYGDLWVLPFTCDEEFTIHNTTRIRNIYSDFKQNAPIEDKSTIGSTQETLNYATAGDSGDWLLGKHGIINMTPEIGPQGPPGRAFFPPMEVIMPSVRKAHPGIFYMVSKMNPAFTDEKVKIEQLAGQRNHTAVTLNLLYKSYRPIEAEISVHLDIVEIGEKSLEEKPTPTIYFFEKSMDDTLPRDLAFVEPEGYGIIPTKDGNSVLYTASQSMTIRSWTYFEAVVILPYSKFKTSTLQISIYEKDTEVYSFVKDIEGNVSEDDGKTEIYKDPSIVLPILLTISFFLILALVLIKRC